MCLFDILRTLKAKIIFDRKSSLQHFGTFNPIGAFNLTFSSFHNARFWIWFALLSNATGAAKMPRRRPQEKNTALHFIDSTATIKRCPLQIARTQTA
jgi:hypothetical protein